MSLGFGSRCVAVDRIPLGRRLRVFVGGCSNGPVPTHDAPVAAASHVSAGRVSRALGFNGEPSLILVGPLPFSQQPQLASLGRRSV